MRIAFLTFEFPDARPGGVGSYVLKCAGSMAAIGHEPHIFTLTLPHSVRQRLPAGVCVHEIPDIAERVESGGLPPTLGAAALAGSQSSYKLLVGALLCDALRSEHQSNRFDVVEAAECEALALPLLLWPVADLPVVVQIHLGYSANAFGNSIAAKERDDLAEALELASIVAADAVCAATQSVVDVTRTLCPFRREVAIVPHGVAIVKDEQISAPPETGAALFVGRLQRRKGCDILASAANLFLKQNATATLRFAGSDTRSGAQGTSMLAEMMERVESSVRDRFVYLGELSQAEVRREVVRCRFQIVPSIVENFANTAVDAMALGRLVIYGGNTGLDEVVGDAGIRVWPLTAELLADKMHLAWNDPAMAQALGGRGFRRVRENFDASTVAQQRVQFFEKVIANHSAGIATGDREWNALSGLQIRAVLGALNLQMSGMAGLQLETPTPGQRLVRELTTLTTRLGRPPKVWLFGAGRFTLRLLGERYRWESLGFSIEGILDDDPRFEPDASHLGLVVRKPGALLEAIGSGSRVDAIVLSTDTLEEIFRRRARVFEDMGVAIFSLIDGS